jgi:hypothetical protein
VTQRKREREKEKAMYKRVVRVTFIWEGERRKFTAVLVVSHAKPARPSGSSIKVKIYEAEEE